MSVHKDERKTGTWFAHIRYTDWTGQRRQHRKRGFATKKEAQEYERTFLTRQSCNGLTVKSLYDIYMDDCRQRLNKAGSLVTASNNLRRAIVYIEDLEVEQVTPQVIRKLQFALQADGFSGRSIRNTIGALSTMFNYGVKYLGLKNNPCHAAGVCVPMKKKEMTIWTEEDFQLFAAAVNPFYVRLFSVLFYTGVRIGEALALTWADIDGTSLRINKTFDSARHVVTPPKTATSVRNIAIPNFLAAMLAARPLDYTQGDRVFPRTVATVRYALLKGIKKSGVPLIRIHDLRHSHASNLLSMGVPIPAVSRRLGHANASITLSVYAHALQADDSAIAHLLSKRKGAAITDGSAREENL